MSVKAPWRRTSQLSLTSLQLLRFVVVVGDTVRGETSSGLVVAFAT